MALSGIRGCVEREETWKSFLLLIAFVFSLWDSRVFLLCLGGTVIETRGKRSAPFLLLLLIGRQPVSVSFLVFRLIKKRALESE